MSTLAARVRLESMRWAPGRRHALVYVTLSLLLIVFAIGSFSFPGFASGQVALNLVVDNAYLIVLAVGMTFVILSGGLDLSVGAVVGLTTVTAASLLRAHWDPTLVIVVVLAIGATLGLVVGLVIHFFDIQPFVATLIAMFFARGLCYVISPDSVSIGDPFFTAMAQTRIPVGPGLAINPSVIVALITVAIGFVVLQYTRTGRTVYAIGNGGESARLMGLPVVRTRILVYAVSGFCASLAGVLFTFYTLSGYSLTGVGMELDAIAAVVIGGTVLTGGSGYVLGSVLGVLVLGTVNTIISFNGTLSSWWTKIIAGALLLLFVLLQRLVIGRVRR